MIQESSVIRQEKGRTFISAHLAISRARAIAGQEAQTQKETMSDKEKKKIEDDRVIAKKRHLDQAKKELLMSHTNESVTVHVTDGSGYGDTPNKKDVEHVKAGAKLHNGEFDGHSDKGVYYKFKTDSDAKSFKKHVHAAPNRTTYADIQESKVQSSLQQLTESIRNLIKE